MGLKFTTFFDNEDYQSSDTRIIICKQCSSHLCLASLIISDGFQGSSGPAYLVEKMINIVPDDTVEETTMKTGIYLVKKVKCHQCLTTIGWNYIKSFSYRESYKEGKYVIERAFISFIENNSFTDNLIKLAKKNFRRRLSSNSTINSCELDDNNPSRLHNEHDDFKFTDPSMKYISTIRLQTVDKLNEKDEQSNNSDNVLVEL